MKTCMTLFICSVFLLAGMVIGIQETEPNDSMDSPQTIGEGTISGAVNGSRDSDIYRVDVPEYHIAFYSLKKTDTGTGSLNMTVFDSSREEITFSYSRSRSSELSVAGQKITNFIRTEDEADYFFIVVSGSGEYDVEVSFEFIDDPDDPPGYSEKPMKLEDGQRFSGKVFSFEEGAVEYNDVDRFIMEVPSDNKVKVKITKKDTGNGTVIADIEGYYEAYDSVDLTEPGESDTLEYEVELYSEDHETVYLDIYGEGEYEIEVTFESTMPDPTLLLGIMGGVMCMVLIISLLPIVIVIIVIVIVIKTTSKGSKKKKKKNTSGKRKHY